eukprot:c27511_g1_i1 orf=442-2163(-)
MRICDAVNVVGRESALFAGGFVAPCHRDAWTLRHCSNGRGCRVHDPHWKEKLRPLRLLCRVDGKRLTQSHTSRKLHSLVSWTRWTSALTKFSMNGDRVQSDMKSESPTRLNGTHSDTTGDSDGLVVSTLAKAFSTFVTSAAATILCLQIATAPAVADSVMITFPASKNSEISNVQRTLVEAWGIVKETFVDPTFNHQDWDSKLQETMLEILPIKTADAAYSKISSMLATLGDPFTRIVNPKEYQSFRIGSDGALEGVGLLISSDRDTGRLFVLSSIEGSPAARAGIHSGDELLQINDESLAGLDRDQAATRLRGPAGTVVKLKLQHPAVAGTAGESIEVNLMRQRIVLSPVFTTVLPHKASDGHLAKTGYVKLVAFSQNAAIDMEKAINRLESEGAESYILDLRNNPGGLVKAGLDVAQMWLDGNETLVNTVDRDGITLPINLANSHALTHDPLIVLVNEGSASASEILASALHDNGRAVLVGSKTFGKGKIQSVTELNDGSALFVTVAKYLSPALHEIDQVGIVPDVQCSSDVSIASSSSGSPKDVSPQPNLVSAIEQDTCVIAAEHQLGLF